MAEKQNVLKTSKQVRVARKKTAQIPQEKGREIWNRPDTAYFPC